jgi:RimJ/RimL family protein N-acetyltransferase
MNHPFITGKRLYLRGLERSDINETYLQWINNAEVTRYMVTGTFPSTMEKLEQYYQRMTTSPNHVILAIVDKESDKHIGNITLNNINWINRTADLGIMIGNKDFWGKGLGTEATKLMVQYAFEKLNLHKIWLGVHVSHEAAIRIYEKAGFEIEGRLRNHFYRDGKYHDMVIMGIIRGKDSIVK